MSGDYYLGLCYACERTIGVSRRELHPGDIIGPINIKPIKKSFFDKGDCLICAHCGSLSNKWIIISKAKAKKFLNEPTFIVYKKELYE